jgi:membrane fusion protein (multidrug efflux system)
VLLGAVLVGAGFWIYPRLDRSLTTVSTDDAFVNAHVTHVAPRIPESVTAVLVDDNDYVHAGDVLVRLDPAMWDVRVSQAQSAVAASRRQRDQAEAKARAGAAGVRASRYQLASAISNIDNQATSLRVAVARLNEAKSAESLAATEAQRYAELASRKSVTQEMADVRRADLEKAQARVRQALGEIHAMRVGLELPEEPPAGQPLDQVPSDLNQRHSTVLAALGQLALAITELGATLPAFYDTPDQFIADIKSRAPGGNIDALIDATVKGSPGVMAAEAQVAMALDQLAEASLSRSYCEIRAAVDGFVSNRSVNPGDRVAANQRLMAIRSFQEVWIDCNFKETQLESIRIGQPVDIYVDAYPHKVFAGRVSGFSPGTGATMALLPPQNATGNFVKIVQRLPVRVELVGGNPPDTPLFVGLSATPRVRIFETPTGPHAGQRLRGNFPAVPLEARRLRLPSPAGSRAPLPVTPNEPSPASP